jgi:hypothetical protein
MGCFICYESHFHAFYLYLKVESSIEKTVRRAIMVFNGNTRIFSFFRVHTATGKLSTNFAYSERAMNRIKGQNAIEPDPSATFSELSLTKLDKKVKSKLLPHMILKRESFCKDSYSFHSLSIE